MLTSKANIIISTTSTPSQTEINAQYSPKSFKTDFESLASENSGRAKSGKMYINWVYSKIRKFEVELSPDSVANISTKLSAVQGKVFYITYWDVLINNERTTQVYCSNSSADWYSGVIYNGLVQGASFNCIEMVGVR